MIILFNKKIEKLHLGMENNKSYKIKVLYMYFHTLIYIRTKNYLVKLMESIYLFVFYNHRY